MAKLTQARGLFAQSFNAGLAGDLEAARRAQSLAPQLLQASRTVNASGTGFVQDFNAEQASLDRLSDVFGTENIDTNRAGFAAVVDTLEVQLGAIQEKLDDLTREVSRQAHLAA